MVGTWKCIISSEEEDSRKFNSNRGKIQPKLPILFAVQRHEEAKSEDIYNSQEKMTASTRPSP